MGVMIALDIGLWPAWQQAFIESKSWRTWSFGNKIQWNLNQNETTFILENGFENDIQFNPFEINTVCNICFDEKHVYLVRSRYKAIT